MTTKVIMDNAFSSIHWDEGVGILPFQKPVVYNGNYFDKYVRYEGTPRGRGITRFRVRAINKLLSYRHRKSHCLDVGIGSGHFLKELNRTTDMNGQGIDINKKGITWLHQNECQCTRSHYDVLTFWDSLEHIPEPWRIWQEYSPKFLAVSLPIFENKEHIRKSRHFRPEEHWWYFTQKGFLNWMETWGWGMVEQMSDEIDLGREDIHTFTFMHKGTGYAR